MEKGNINLKKWKSIKFLSLLMLYAIFFSCRSHEVALHYYNGLNSDKNHTWSSSLQIFFEKDEEMTKVPIKSKILKEELSNIRNKIITKNQVLDFDDGNYSFAFINEKDTLFADDRLEFWKYRDKGLAVKLSGFSKKKILEYYKISPNQY
ncbi:MULTISPECIES: hypothetical protein [Chryseobacterium]|uniref:hypothetical protein n=1 Tax=Chryseobacterium TaxID=59732 RepID=UPI000C9E1430|nr:MULTISPECIES: hypothetical protein [Chryseobacterium]VXB72076.1 conserved hypothetical protein [Chryseobacterium sp. 8AT]